jgi:tetratricopeptide (TPR) repeat protein
LNYYYALASIYQVMNDYEGLVSVLEEALTHTKSSNDIWKIEENLAVFTSQLGRNAEALQHAQNAYNAAPESEKDRLAQLIQQIEAAP